MHAGKIVILMAGAAAHGSSALAMRAAAHVHDVCVKIVALARIVPARVADEASGMPQRGHDGLKCRDPTSAILGTHGWSIRRHCAEFDPGSRE
jgi:hypothetical protein